MPVAHFVLFDELAQVALLAHACCIKEALSSDWGHFLILSEVCEHLIHVSITGHANEELLQHAREGNDWHLEASASLALLNTTRVLDEVEKLANADLLAASDGELAGSASVHGLGDGVGQVTRVHWLELSVVGEEASLDLSSHGALVHVVDEMRGVRPVDQVRVEDAHLAVGAQGLLLRLLSLLNPALGVVRVRHVVLDGAHGDDVGDTELFSRFRSGHQSVILAGGHGEVIMSHIDDLVCTLHVDLETADVREHSLVDLDASGGHLPLEVVRGGLVGVEIEHSNAVILATLGEVPDDRFGQVVGSVDDYELH